MKWILSLFVLILSPSVFAEDLSVSLAIGETQYKFRSQVENSELQFKGNDTQNSLALGMSSKIYENIHLGAELQASVSESSTQSSARTIKIIPSWNSNFYSLWLLGGFNFHDFRDLSVNHQANSSSIGFAFRPQSGIENVTLNFEVLYEKSIWVESFEIKNIKFAKYRFEGVHSAIGLGYKL